MLETFNDKLSNSLKEIHDDDKHELEELVGHIKKAEKSAGVVRRYEEILKTKDVKIINSVGKQGQLLKQFKDSEDIFQTVSLSRSTIYFKVTLYRFFCKSRSQKNLYLLLTIS